MTASTPLPLLFPVSHSTSEINKTGAWRFARPAYRFKTAPCSVACPAGIDIARTEMLAARGRLQEAWETICLENPLPSVCGRVCFHPCETACNRAELDAPIAINALERHIGDAALAAGSPLVISPAARQNRKAAIVGAGPAGLAAAYFLAGLGIAAEIFEAAPEPGGVLRWGIPGYRLPKDVLDREIRRIRDLGIPIHCGRRADEAFLEEAAASHDALLLGVGLAAPVRMNIPGEDLIVEGLDFLRRVQTETPAVPQGEVAVIGGGNTAIDVARTLLRLGARPTIVYRRRRQDMPAYGHEVDAALAEGVRLLELKAPLAVTADGDGLQLLIQPMQAADVAGDGRVRAVPTDETAAAMHFKAVFSGIGAALGAPWHEPPREAQTIRLSHCALTVKDTPSVYIGDPVTPANSVADAIASGKQAALALHTLFNEDAGRIGDAVDRCRVGPGPALSMEIYRGGTRCERAARVVAFADINPDYFPQTERHAPPALAPDAAAGSFDEAVDVLAPEAALAEAARCFNCGICNDCDNCRIFCPEQTVRVAADGRSIDLEFCKGCGVCTVECPRGAMDMEEESA